MTFIYTWFIDQYVHILSIKTCLSIFRSTILHAYYIFAPLFCMHIIFKLNVSLRENVFILYFKLFNLCQYIILI